MSEIKLTDAQFEARRKAIALLGEHFDSFVLVTQTDAGNDPENDEPLTITHGAYEGSRATALGLLLSYQHDLLQPPDQRIL